MSASIDIATLIVQSRAVPIERELERRGIKLRGRVDRCGPWPVCGGTDRFSINVKKQVWNCRGCALGGDVIALVQHLDRTGFVTALQVLAGERVSSPAAPTVAPASSVAAEYHRQKQHRKAAWLWSQAQAAHRIDRGNIPSESTRHRVSAAADARVLAADKARASPGSDCGLWDS